LADPRTRTLDQLVEELHDLSRGEGWGNLVLVAHSFGGFVARAFADKYPDEVLGMLLLDVAHENWLPRLKVEMSTADWAIMERILDWNTRTFHEDYVEAQEAVRRTTIRTDLPITVLARGVPHTRIRLERMSYAGLDSYENQHTALQPSLAKLSTNAEYRVAQYSSHVFDDYDPWLVIDEIKSLVNRLPE
jgi:pimeloyl-ACP methyl ester carboxylesterase